MQQEIARVRAETDQYLGRLRAEADQLLAGLLPQGAPARASAQSPAQSSAQAPAAQFQGAQAQSAPYQAAPLQGAPFPFAPFPADGPGPAETYRRPARSLSGQQVLLGLGALLLLSGVSFFLLVVWLVVGVAGQAVIMLTLTGLAVVATAQATTRSLPAAAETFAVVSTGLLVLDLWAAHALGLARLDNLPGDVYWAGAGLVGGLVLLGFDRVVPRGGADPDRGAPLRRVLTYLPAASTLFCVAAVALTFALADGFNLGDVGASFLALVLAVAGAVAVALARRFDVPEAPVRRQGVAWLSWAAVPPAVLSLLALATSVGTGAAVGYAPGSTGLERYTAMLLLLAVPALLLGLLAVPGARMSQAARRAAQPFGLADVAVVAALPALGILVVDAHRLLLVGLAFVVAVAVVADLVLRVRGSAPRTARAAPRPSAAGLVGWLVLPVLVALVILLADEGAVDLLAAMDAATGWQVTSPWWLPVLPALAWLAAAVGATVVTRVASWQVVLQMALLATLYTACRDAAPVVQVAVALVASAASLAWAGYLRAQPETGELDLVDAATVAFAAIYGVVAILASLQESAYLTSAAFVVTGVCTLAYAGSRGRLGFGYPGAVLVSAGTSVLFREGGVDLVEAYTLPLALLLAGLGWVQHRRAPSTPTLLTMAPALSTALLPSASVAIAEGDAVRLLLVTLAAVAVLAAGLARRWKAPVTVAGVVLLMVAISQGGPLIGYVDGWVTLIGTGALLLAIGVWWEKAVLAGRRSATWYAALR
ncbi:SCO7613 C-terminal domain-containing membrane protein [Nocardioides campestrisoli]|uniref:SCO7613 C-terminal domain-containing membrane protein n=1 Tax=Nocardioides campestrisoli TaxID=2736757 RepID=UPI0015E79300|nr:hypothetical protein [Nocardioides campestrisoli]